MSMKELAHIDKQYEVAKNFAVFFEEQPPVLHKSVLEDLAEEQFENGSWFDSPLNTAYLIQLFQTEGIGGWDDAKAMVFLTQRGFHEEHWGEDVAEIRAYIASFKMSQNELEFWKDYCFRKPVVSEKHRWRVAWDLWKAATVLPVFHKMGLSQQVEEIRTALLDSQTESGFFCEGCESHLDHTARFVESLLDVGESPSSGMLKNAKAWMLEHLRQLLSGDEISQHPSIHTITSPQVLEAQGIATLTRMGVSTDHPILKSAREQLKLAQQDNGSWRGNVHDTLHALEALSRIGEHIDSPIFSKAFSFIKEHVTEWPSCLGQEEHAFGQSLYMLSQITPFRKA